MRNLRGPYAGLAVWAAVLIALLAGCRADRQPAADPPVGTPALLVFSVDPEAMLSEPKLAGIPPETSLSEALDRLGKHLATGYFAPQDPPETADIRFEVQGITLLPSGSRHLRVATIDMIDPKGTALTDFFQGSMGAQSTFHLVAATFLQPQLDPPLLDGMILLYNGERFPVMDHVQLSEIVVPEQVRRAVVRAVQWTAAHPTA